MNSKDPVSPTNRSGRVRSATIIAERRRKEKRRRLLIQLGIGLVVVVAVLGTTVAVLKSQDDTAAATAPPNLTTSGGVVLGNASAPVTVTVVEDFGCPHCKVFEEDAGSLLAGYATGTDVKVEYRGIAFLDRAFATNYSSRALNASACVAATSTTEVWKKFHDALFAEQPAEGSKGLDSGALASRAVAAGATVGDCITRGTYLDWVKAQTDATLGHDGVEGTPTVFVNDVLVERPSAATVAAAVAGASAS